MADAGLQAFRMTIEAIVAITGRAGAHLGGEIESGVLAGAELRRAEDGALPGSMSGPVYRRETAAALGFADRCAPLLAVLGVAC